MTGRGGDGGSKGPDAPARGAAVAMLCMLLATYVINAMDRQLFPMLVPEVQRALHLSLPQAGLAATIFTLGMGLGGPIAVLSLRRLRRKDAALLGIMLFSIATFLSAYVHSFSELLILRFISGAGEAIQLAAILAIGTTYFSTRRALAASSMNFAFGLGAILGPIVGAEILARSDWTTCFLLFGLCGLPAGLLIAIAVRPGFSEARVPSNRTKAVRGRSDRGGWLSPTPIIFAIATGFVGLALYGYLALYPTYLRQALGFSAKEAGFTMGGFGLGALLSLFGGLAGDRYGQRRVLCIALPVATASSLLLFAPLGSGHLVPIASSVVFGASISGMAYANLSAAIITSVNRDEAAEASALFITALYVPAAFAGYLLGALKEELGWAAASWAQLGGGTVIATLLCLFAGRVAIPRQSLSTSVAVD